MSTSDYFCVCVVCTEVPRCFETSYLRGRPRGTFVFAVGERVKRRRKRMVLLGRVVLIEEGLVWVEWDGVVGKHPYFSEDIESDAGQMSLDFGRKR